MPTITTFRQLILWQKAMDLAARCCILVRTIPRSDRDTLGQQIQRAAISVPSSIAEGFNRHSTPFYVRQLWGAHASGAELETELELGRRIGLISEPDADVLIVDAQEVGRMIIGLITASHRASCPRSRRRP